MSTSLTSKICCRIIGPQDNSFCEIAGQSMSLTSVHGCPVFNLQTTLAVLIKLSTYVLHSNVSCRIAFLGDASDCSEIHLLSRNKKVCVCVCVCVKQLVSAVPRKCGCVHMKKFLANFLEVIGFS